MSASVIATLLLSVVEVEIRSKLENSNSRESGLHGFSVLIEGIKNF